MDELEGSYCGIHRNLKRALVFLFCFFFPLLWMCAEAPGETRWPWLCAKGDWFLSSPLPLINFLRFLFFSLLFKGLPRRVACPSSWLVQRGRGNLPHTETNHLCGLELVLILIPGRHNSTTMCLSWGGFVLTLTTASVNEDFKNQFQSLCYPNLISGVFPLLLIFAPLTAALIIMIFFNFVITLFFTLLHQSTRQAASPHFRHQGSLSEWSVTCLHSITTCQRGVSSAHNQERPCPTTLRLRPQFTWS